MILCGNEEISLCQELSHQIIKIENMNDENNERNFRKYLKKHFESEIHTFAQNLDLNKMKPLVQYFTSDIPGMGKSYYIQRQAKTYHIPYIRIPFNASFV